MGVEESSVGGVVELEAIVGLERLNGTRKLRLNIFVEQRKKVVNFGFVTQRKSPNKMCEIIKNHKIILIA